MATLHTLRTTQRWTGSLTTLHVIGTQIVEHQRLSGSGYCFSASLPPYLATAADVSLKQLADKGPKLVAQLHRNSTALRREIKKIPGGTDSMLRFMHLFVQPRVHVNSL